MKYKVLNAAGFQLCWFACVLGGNSWALVASGIFALLHLLLLDAQQWRGSLLFALAGATADTLLLTGGFTAYPDASAHIIPVWLMLLWLVFALTLPLSLSFFRGKALLAAVAGALMAPVSYFAGEKAGAISITLPGYALISAYWATALALYYSRSKAC